MIWVKFANMGEYKRLTNLDYTITSASFIHIRVFLIDEIEYVSDSPEFRKAFNKAIMWEKLCD